MKIPGLKEADDVSDQLSIEERWKAEDKDAKTRLFITDAGEETLIEDLLPIWEQEE